jgi:hypothetical protein
MVCHQPYLTPYVVGITDLRAFIAPYLKKGHLLEVSAIATRIVRFLTPEEGVFKANTPSITQAEHLRVRFP